MATALRLDKLPALRPSAVGAKRQKSNRTKPVLKLDCRVCPRRPEPQLLYLSRSRPASSRSPLSSSEKYEASDSPSPYCSQAAGASEHQTKRVRLAQWPDDNCPFSAATAFLMECKTSASSCPSCFSVCRAQGASDSNSTGAKKQVSPFTAILSMIAGLKPGPRKQINQSQPAAVQPLHSRVRFGQESKIIRPH